MTYCPDGDRLHALTHALQALYSYTPDDEGGAIVQFDAPPEEAMTAYYILTSELLHDLVMYHLPRDVAPYDGVCRCEEPPTEQTCNCGQAWPCKTRELMQPLAETLLPGWLKD